MPSSPGSVGLARAHPLIKTQAMESSRQTWSSYGPPYPLGRWSSELRNYQITRVFAMKTIQPTIPSNLKKARFIPASLLTVFAMSESPKFHQITKKYKSRIEKRNDRLASRSAACFFRNTEKRYLYVTTAAAQQQHSSSAAAAVAQQKQQRRRWWRFRRRRRRRRQHGKPFFAQLSQQRRGPPEGEERPYKKYGRRIITPPDV